MAPALASGDNRPLLRCDDNRESRAKELTKPCRQVAQCRAGARCLHSVYVKPCGIYKTAMGEFKKGCGQPWGRLAAREPGLGTGRGGDVTGVA